MNILSNKKLTLLASVSRDGSMVRDRSLSYLSLRSINGGFVVDTLAFREQLRRRSRSPNWSFPESFSPRSQIRSHEADVGELNHLQPSRVGALVAAMVLKAKPRAMLLGLLPSKKILASAISGKAAALRSSARHVDLLVEYDGESNEDDYLSHCLFDLDDAGDGEEGWSDGHDACSAINWVRSSREDSGAEFILEEEINHVADVFIRRVRSQMMLQN